MHIGILGIGSYVPDKIITNADLEKMVDTTDEWITTRTGIKERRIAPADVPTSSLAVSAAKRAIADAGCQPQDISLIITATITPDYQFPSTACIVQDRLGIKNAAAFDICAACSGFIFGLEIARAMMCSSGHKKALVIGAEKMSSVVDWTDRNICVLLGDGAGACVLGGVPSRGIIASEMAVDGSFAEILFMPAGGSHSPATEQTVNKKMHYMKMQGREVYKHAVSIMTRTCKEILAKNNLKIDDIDCFIPHQANMRIIEAVADRLDIPISRVYMNLTRYGNMSAASIPVAFDEAVKSGVVKKGSRVLLAAFGAGLTWGASIIEV